LYIGVQGQTESDKATLVVWDLFVQPSEIYINILDGTLASSIIHDVEQYVQETTSGYR